MCVGGGGGGGGGGGEGVVERGVRVVGVVERRGGGWWRGRWGWGGVVDVAFLSQVQNIPERINQISNTGLR